MQSLPAEKEVSPLELLPPLVCACRSHRPFWLLPGHRQGLPLMSPLLSKDLRYRLELSNVAVSCRLQGPTSPGNVRPLPRADLSSQRQLACLPLTPAKDNCGHHRSRCLR